MEGWKISFLLGRPIFRGYVSFREGNLQGCKHQQTLQLQVAAPTQKTAFQVGTAVVGVIFGMNQATVLEAVGWKLGKETCWDQPHQLRFGEVDTHHYLRVSYELFFFCTIQKVVVFSLGFRVEPSRVFLLRLKV